MRDVSTLSVIRKMIPRIRKQKTEWKGDQFLARFSKCASVSLLKTRKQKQTLNNTPLNFAQFRSADVIRLKYINIRPF